MIASKLNRQKFTFLQDAAARFVADWRKRQERRHNKWPK
jgi:hypothetical protein